MDEETAVPVDEAVMHDEDEEVGDRGDAGPNGSVRWQMYS